MFNIWTFLLEIINFLVLVWILKRFLYRPIVGIIDRRRERIRGELESLEAQRAELERGRREHEEQVRGLERQRERIIGEARAAAEEERRKIMERAREEGRREQEKLRSVLEEERREVLRAVQEQVVERAVEISKRLVAAVAGDSLNDALIASGLRELQALPAERARKALGSLPEPRVRVVSARALTAGQRQAFEQALLSLLDGQVALDLARDEGLGAGVRIELGELVLNSTLAVQLERVRKEPAEALEEAEGGGEAG